MVAPFLVEAEMALGREACNALKKDATIDPLLVMWFYDDDASEWRYLIATEFATKEPLAAYRRVGTILRKARLGDNLPLNKVVVLSPESPLVKQLSQLVYPGDNSEVSMYNCAIGDLVIHGAVIYRLKRPPRRNVKSSRDRMRAKT